MKSILIIEDEPDIQELLRAYLEDAGYQTTVAGDGVAALERFGAQPFDLVLLDLMLPKIDGFGVCEMIRRQSQVPILMLTALDGEEQQLRGFRLDIDDYITKPFSMPVLLEKIRVVLRRRGSAGEDSRLRYRDLTLDLDSREALLDGRALDLTAREFELLHTFLAAPGRVFTREMLLWPRRAGCSPGRCSSPSSGATTSMGTSGWWTATSRTSATSWGGTTSKR